MGARFVHRCDRCGYSVFTSGPWEFYRDRKGRRKPYGHPGPMSDEAKERGIYGLSADVYCANCDTVFDVILVEFKEPSREGLSVWGARCEPKDEFKGVTAVKCPACGADLILGAKEGKVAICPRCKEGKLMGEMEWIS